MSEHRLVPARGILERRAAGKFAEVEGRERSHLDRMGVGRLLLAGRIRRDPVGGGLLDDLVADRLVEGQDHPGHVLEGETLESLELEDRGLEAKQEARIGAVLQRLRARPAGRPFAAAEEGGQASGERARGLAEAARDEREAAERWTAHELGAGDEDDRLAPQIVGDGGAGDPRLAGVDDEGDGSAMRLRQAIEILQSGQDQAGLRAVDDMDEDMAAGGLRLRRWRRPSSPRSRPTGGRGRGRRGPERRSSRHGSRRRPAPDRPGSWPGRAPSRERNSGRRRSGCSRSRPRRRRAGCCGCRRGRGPRRRPERHIRGRCPTARRRCRRRPRRHRPGGCGRAALRAAPHIRRRTGPAPARAQALRHGRRLRPKCRWRSRRRRRAPRSGAAPNGSG